MCRAKINVADPAFLGDKIEDEEVERDNKNPSCSIGCPFPLFNITKNAFYDKKKNNKNDDNNNLPKSF